MAWTDADLIRWMTDGQTSPLLLNAVPTCLRKRQGPLLSEATTFTQSNTPGISFNPGTAQINSEKNSLLPSYAFFPNPNTTACLAPWKAPKQNMFSLNPSSWFMLFHWLHKCRGLCFFDWALGLSLSTFPCVWASMLQTRYWGEGRTIREKPGWKGFTVSDKSWHYPEATHQPFEITTEHRPSGAECGWIAGCGLQVWSYRDDVQDIVECLGLARL